MRNYVNYCLASSGKAMLPYKLSDMTKSDRKKAAGDLLLNLLDPLPPAKPDCPDAAVVCRDCPASDGS